MYSKEGRNDYEYEYAMLCVRVHIEQMGSSSSGLKPTSRKAPVEIEKEPNHSKLAVTEVDKDNN